MTNTSYNIIFLQKKNIHTSRFFNEIKLTNSFANKSIADITIKPNIASVSSFAKLENKNEKIVSNISPLFKENNLKSHLNITENSRYFFLKRLKFKDEKKILQFSKLKKHLNRKWRWKKSKLSKFNLKFKDKMFLLIYNRIKSLRKSKLKSKIKSNIVSKLRRMISYYQFHNSKTHKKIYKIINEYHSLLLFSNEIFSNDKYKIKTTNNSEEFKKQVKINSNFLIKFLNKMEDNLNYLFTSGNANFLTDLPILEEKHKLVSNVVSALATEQEQKKENSKLIKNITLDPFSVLLASQKLSRNKIKTLPIASLASLKKIGAIKLIHKPFSGSYATKQRFVPLATQQKENIEIWTKKKNQIIKLSNAVSYATKINDSFSANYATKKKILSLLSILKASPISLKKEVISYNKNLLTIPILKNNKELFHYKNALLYFYLIKGFIGRYLNYNHQLYFNSRVISYSFNKINNYYNLLSSTNFIDKLLKELMIDMFSLISKPIFIIKKDKIIIQIFFFLAPFANSKLKSGIISYATRPKYKKGNKKNYYSSVFSEDFQYKYWKNLTKFQLMNYNPSNFINSLTKMSLVNKKKTNKNWNTDFTSITKEATKNFLFLNNIQTFIPSFVNPDLNEIKYTNDCFATEIKTKKLVSLSPIDSRESLQNYKMFIKTITSQILFSYSSAYSSTLATEQKKRNIQNINTTNLKYKGLIPLFNNNFSSVINLLKKNKIKNKSQLLYLIKSLSLLFGGTKVKILNKSTSFATRGATINYKNNLILNFPFLFLKKKFFSNKFLSSTRWLVRQKYNKKILSGLKFPLNLFLFKAWPLNRLQLYYLMRYISNIFFNFKENKELSTRVNKKIRDYYLKQELDVILSSQINKNYLIKANEIEDFVLPKPILIANKGLAPIKEEDLIDFHLMPEPQFFSFFTLFKNKLTNLSLLLNKIFNIKVEFELIKLEIPFHDSNMISQVLGMNSTKLYFYRMWRKLLPKMGIHNPTQNFQYLLEKKQEEIERKEKGYLYDSSSYLPSLFDFNKLNSKFIGFKQINYQLEKPVFPLVASQQISKINSINKYIYSYVSGINLKLAGRLMTQKMRPRFTVQTKQNGSLARVKVDYVEKSRFTSKNKRGAFSFTVSIGHIIK